MGKIIKTSKGYGILGEFEVGDSGEYAQRILVKDTSKKKAKELLNKWLKGEL